jgi:hypothetical protein
MLRYSSEAKGLRILFHHAASFWFLLWENYSNHHINDQRRKLVDITNARVRFLVVINNHDLFPTVGGSHYSGFTCHFGSGICWIL